MLGKVRGSIALLFVHQSIVGHCCSWPKQSHSVLFALLFPARSSIEGILHSFCFASASPFQEVACFSPRQSTEDANRDTYDAMYGYPQQQQYTTTTGGYPPSMGGTPTGYPSSGMPSSGYPMGGGYPMSGMPSGYGMGGFAPTGGMAYPPQSGGYPPTNGYPQSGGYPPSTGCLIAIVLVFTVIDQTIGGYPQTGGYPAPSFNSGMGNQQQQQGPLTGWVVMHATILSNGSLVRDIL